MTADGVLDEIAGAVWAIRSSTPVAVAVDGPDVAGKTTFADRLAERVATRRPVLRVEADHFENPRALRYRRGANSAEGYYKDTYNDEALESLLLAPLKVGRPVATATYDWHRDVAVAPSPVRVPPHGVVIVDGCFLLRARLHPHFDLSILLLADEEVRLRRALSRDVRRLGSAKEVISRYRTRYIPGFELYMEQETPVARADYVIDNSNLAAPLVTRRPAG